MFLKGNMMRFVVERFADEFRKFINSPFTVPVVNCTAALHTANLLVGIKPGDKVVTTPFSFIATANSILYCGGTPVFADIDPSTYCIDPDEVEKKLREHPAIKAIICVHLFGKLCDMDGLMRLSRKYQVALIEDCAQHCWPPAGTLGDVGCFSFYLTKYPWTFQGGMLTMKTRDFAEKAKMIINHGQSSKYQHEILGFNYQMSPICALIGLGHMLHKETFQYALGSYGVNQGHYPKVIYEQPLYKKLGIKGNCPNAEKAAKEARKHFKVIV